MSFALMIMIASLLPSYFYFDFSSSIILGISIFTLLYSLADTPLVKSNMMKYIIVLLSAPMGLIFGVSSYAQKTSEIEISRISNSTTLMALSFMIIAITFNDKKTKDDES